MNHINFTKEIGENVRENMETGINSLEVLTNVNDIKNRVSLVTSIGGKDEADFIRNYKDQKEIQEIKMNFYEKFIDDIEYLYNKEDGKILIQVPSTHAKDFIPLLIERKHNLKSKFANINIEYVIMDTQSISKVGDSKIELMNLYVNYIKKIFNADKFIEINDTTKSFELFSNNEYDQNEIKGVRKLYMNKISELQKTKPRLKTYFPSQEQADLEGMSLKDFYKLCSRASSINWKRIKEANEQLVDLFRESNEVTIKGEYADINFNIKGMGARNSVIETNYPGSEVFTAPVKESVNGWITYNNPVYFRFTGETIEGLKFTFKDGKLVDLSIEGDKHTEEEKLSILVKMNEIFDEKEGNRYMGELAFGTNFFVPAGIKHGLIGEKAIGMHFALGKAYKYDEVDNGNHDTSIHWDAIRNMEDKSIVTFTKNDGEEIEVMNNGSFNKEVLPKISKYQEEIKKEEI